MTATFARYANFCDEMMKKWLNIRYEAYIQDAKASFFDRLFGSVGDLSYICGEITLKTRNMCKISMTFEVSDSKSIDIEALKIQMQGYLDFILSMPNIYKPEMAATDEEWSKEEEQEAFLTTSRHNAAKMFAKYL